MAGFRRRILATVLGLVTLLPMFAPNVAHAQPVSISADFRAGATPAGVMTPTAWAARRQAVAQRVPLAPSPAHQALARVLDPGDYECGPTAFDAYLRGLLTGLGDDELEFLFTSGVLDFPTYDALLFGSNTNAAYVLPSDYAKELSRSFIDAQRFWDIPSADIRLMAMHGSMLLDVSRLERLLTVLYGLTPADAHSYAVMVAGVVDRVPAFADGANPIFTLNAYAFTGEGDPDPLLAALPDKIVFGDGILDALEWMGIADVGPRAVLAHEFGHHVQFEHGLFDNFLPSPEATRRTELMADALSTYFSTHSRGLALNAKRVLQAESTFYIVGDCAFDYPGHHGTPNQRLRAATWGVDLADSAHKQGHIPPSATVIGRFDAALPDLVRPDA